MVPGGTDATLNVSPSACWSTTDPLRRRASLTPSDGASWAPVAAETRARTSIPGAAAATSIGEYV
jgi:hypothetical protein